MAKRRTQSTLLTEEAARRIVDDVYTALSKGAYKVVPNPHKTVKPVKLTDKRRAELIEALADEN
jgi:hypothetical protein